MTEITTTKKKKENLRITAFIQLYSTKNCLEPILSVLIFIILEVISFTKQNFEGGNSIIKSCLNFSIVFLYPAMVKTKLTLTQVDNEAITGEGGINASNIHE